MDQMQDVNNTPAPQPVQTGKSSDPLKMWVVLLVILFLAAAGFALWQTLQAGSLSSKVGELESNASQLQANNNSLQAELDMLKGASGDDEGQTSTVDTTKILAATDAYVRAPKSVSGSTFEYSVVKNADGFARVTVAADDGGGYAVWLKKVGDNWTVLVTGQDNPNQETIDKYGIPDAVLQ